MWKPWVLSKGVVLLLMAGGLSACSDPEPEVHVAWRAPAPETATALRVGKKTPLPLTEEPRRVLLEGEVRPAMVRPFGEASIRDLPSLEPCARLELFVATTAGGSTVRIEVGAESETDSESPSAAAEPVFHTSIPARRRGRWRRLELPVDSLKDQGADRLTLRAESAGETVTDRVLWGELHCLASGPAPALDGPNVLFVVLDTLRPDRMSAYGYERETTPFLERWAREEAVLFEQVVAAAPWTLPATYSMLTGLDALRHGMNHSRSGQYGGPRLPEIFRDRGYRTHAITAGGYLRPQYGLSEGFDRYAVWDGPPEDELDTHLELLEDWLTEQQHERFFQVFHTYEIHGPHRRREPYFERLATPTAKRLDETRIGIVPSEWREDSMIRPPFWLKAFSPDGHTLVDANPEQRELAGSMYDSAIAYTDAALADLFEALEDLGLYDDLMIVVTSDHGEALGEDGEGAHTTLDDHTLMVPLLVRFPDGQGAGLRIREQVRQVDIAPTLLDALGWWDERPLGVTDGRSLLPAIEAGRVTDVPEAWSYSGNTNRGLTLRYAGRWKAWINNTAERRLLGRGRVESLRGGDEAPRSVESVKRLAEEYLRGASAGIGLDVQNRLANRRFVLRTDSTDLGIERLKSWSFDCRCVDWQGDAWRARLNPGEDLSLTLEALGTDELRLRLRLRPFPHARPVDDLRTQLEVDLTALTDGPRAWSIGEDGVAHSVSASAPVSDAEIRITVGRRGRVVRDAGELDDTARRQLEALGYL